MGMFSKPKSFSKVENAMVDKPKLLDFNDTIKLFK